MRLPWFYELPGRMIVTRRGETIPIATLFDLIPKFDRSGYHVIYEHIFARSKAWQQLSIELDITWAVLDTPFEICLERMRARRKSGEVNEEVMRKGYAQYGREHVRAERAGVNVVPLRHDNALDDLNELAYAGGWEP